MIRKRNVLPGRFRQQTHSEMKLPVSAEHEWTTAVIRVDSFRAQKPLELPANHEIKERSQVK